MVSATAVVHLRNCFIRQLAGIKGHEGFFVYRFRSLPGSRSGSRSPGPDPTWELRLVGGAAERRPEAGVSGGEVFIRRSPGGVWTHRDHGVCPPGPKHVTVQRKRIKMSLDKAECWLRWPNLLNVFYPLTFTGYFSLGWILENIQRWIYLIKWVKHQHLLFLLGLCVNQ